MSAESTEGKPKRSKVMRYILIAVALAFFWTTRHQVGFDFDNGKIVRYNKWNGQVDVLSVPRV